MNRSAAPLVSIITVVLNCEKYIEKTIKSVLNQTYKNIEYIIIDGGSIDKTVRIIESFQKKIDFWISEKDKGIYDAMNKGILQSSGEIIGLLHSGDWYEKDAIEKIVNFRNEKVLKKEKYIITGDRILRKEDGKKKALIIPHSNYEKMINYTLPISHCATFVSRDIYLKYGMYNTSYTSSADMEFFLRIYKANKIKPVYLSQIILNTTPGGISYSMKGIFESTSISFKYGAPTFTTISFSLFKVFRRALCQLLPLNLFKNIYYKLNRRYLTTYK